MSTIVKAPVRAEARALAEVLRAYAEPLSELTHPDSFTCIDRFADAKIVMLGAATPGTAEFISARAAITRRLIERHGFSILALEADWPEAREIDREVRGPADFVRWLRSHNAGLPARERVELRGLDIYGQSASTAAVIHFLDNVDPKAARAARARYGCLTPWQGEPADHARADPCEDKVAEQLQELLKKRLADMTDEGDTPRNARLVQAGEAYYRALFRGARESWNLRDRHMFETLQTAMAARPQAKAVVWAHNAHVGNAAATAMGWQGAFTIGELARNAYQDRVALIGFGTDRGTVAAAPAWGAEIAVMRVEPARADSFEGAFREAGVSASFTDWRSRARPELVEALSTARLERAIGAVYRPETEVASHYFQAVLSVQFDAFVWVEETHAVTPSASA